MARYSQNDEDEIIQYLLTITGPEPRDHVFVEIGTGPDARQCNTRALRELGWTGFWIDKEGVPPVIRAKVTPSNVNPLLRNLGLMPGHVGLLSIDIDGQDLYVWRAITCIDPQIVVIEYNASLGLAFAAIPLDDDFVWDGHSWKFGASLAALDMLAETKRYVLARANSVNAFFVRRDLWTQYHYREPAFGFKPAPSGSFVPPQ